MEAPASPPQLVHGDAAEVLASYDDDVFDAVITDPPYGVTMSSTDPRWAHSTTGFDPDFWREVARVTKSGASLAVFGHSRTWARTAVAIEEAGWQIVDTLAWITGQGFAAANRHLSDALRPTHPDLAHDYRGWGTMLRPAFEPVILARNLREGATLTEAIRQGGTGGFNIDATRIDAGDEDRSRRPGRTARSVAWGFDRPEGHKSQPSAHGRHPSNVLLQHHPACSATGCEADCPVAVVREQGSAHRGRGEDASRLYQSFFHHPRARRSERTELDGHRSHSVKPLNVMTWLVELTTRPGDLILDPFAGTGTTLEAAYLLGRRSIGCELDAAQATLAADRIQQYQ